MHKQQNETRCTREALQWRMTERSFYPSLFFNTASFSLYFQVHSPIYKIPIKFTSLNFTLIGCVLNFTILFILVSFCYFAFDIYFCVSVLFMCCLFHCEALCDFCLSVSVDILKLTTEESPLMTVAGIHLVRLT